MDGSFGMARPQVVLRRSRIGPGSVLVAGSERGNDRS